MRFRFLVFLVIILLFLIIRHLLRNNQNRKMQRRKPERDPKAGEFLQAIDAKYQHFVEKRIPLNILNSNSIEMNIEDLSRETFTILKPDIDGLITHIEASDIIEPEINYSSKYFKNVEALIYRTYRTTYNKSQPSPPPYNRDAFYDAFQDAIKADLTDRSIDLKNADI